MARKSSNRNGPARSLPPSLQRAGPYNIQAQRAAFNRWVALTAVQAARASHNRQFIAQLEDRRRYDPTKSVRAPRSVRRSDTRLRDIRNTIFFTVPDRIALCAKRKIRREVLFAFGKTGLGSKTKFRKRNEWSNVSC